METETEDWDSDSDGPDFYGPTGIELEDFLNNTADASSVRSTVLSTSTSTVRSQCKEDEDILLINNVLLLNKQSEAKYKRLEEVLYKSLLEIRKKIEDNSQAMITHTNGFSNSEYNYIRCVKPYFKDRQYFSPPPNSDTVLMKQAQMYDFSMTTSVPGWTVKDKTLLVNMLQEFSRNILKQEYNSQISKLLKEDNAESSHEIAILEKKIKGLKKKTLKEIALPIDQEYVWEIVANKLNRRHTAQEYQALWKLFFHPSINKSSWTKSEHRTLQNLANAHNMQNWDLIAKKLGTGRTGYQCFIYFRTNMIDSFANGRKWTAEETEYLQRVIEYFKEGTFIHWGKVSTAMDNRTKIQVYNKYCRLVEQRKGRFLEEEDIVIMNCIEKFGQDFKRMTDFLPGRSAVQLRTRFNLLSKFKVSTTWTVEDDRKLLQIMANQDSNCSFSDATKHFPGKDRFHIRSRYLTLKKWMKTHPSTDIAHAPRRGARRLIHGCADVTLNEALANLNKRMESEVDKKKKTQLSILSHEKDIEAGITAALITEIRKGQCNTRAVPQTLDEIVVDSNEDTSTNIQNLQRILVFLKARLDVDYFEKSSYSMKFSSLKETATPSYDHKVKSYSRKKKISSIPTFETPDIWGQNTLGELKYVLPPNMSTITGCRVLLNNISMRSEDNADDISDINLGLMTRMNDHLKFALNKLKERFQSLFLWPLLLSNELPSTEKQTYSFNVDYVRAPRKRPSLLPAPSGVIIPLPKRRKTDNDTAIDLVPSKKIVKNTVEVNYNSLPGTSGIDD